MSTTHIGSPRSRTTSIQLLGPVRATADGEPDGDLPLGSRLQRGVLAILALRAGQLVPQAQVVADLWGEAAPATAAGTLRAYVSRLRSAIGASTVPRVDGGYLLDLDRAAVDALAAADDLAGARRRLAEDPSGALQEADAVLARWRGTPLADLGPLPFVHAAVEGLEELRRSAQQVRARAQLAGGHHAAVLDDLLPHLAAQPDDEHATHLVAVALYRAGRQAEALARLAALRDALADRHGMDPGPQAQRVQAAILAQDPALLVGDPLAAEGDRVVRASGSAPIVSRGAVQVDPSPVTRPASRPASLPVPLTSFVGRSVQLTVVERLAGTGRMLTLTGVGGVGKTRLALEAARRTAGHGLDGPWLVELAGIAADDVVPAAVAQAVGVAAVGITPMDALVEALQPRQAVLLLDNCEHVADGVADLVVALLQACPGLRVLATSREPLGVVGEQVLVVPSLPTGGGADGRPGEAAQLFADRAALADPGFVLDDRTGPLVARICEALDGIPLALELAAGQLGALSLDHLVDLLDDRFEVLQARRGTVPRHRTLAAAIAWSYDPLDADERAVLHAAATFSGGFDLEALAVVAGGVAGTSAAAVARHLTTLVGKSMVTTVDRAGTRRYVVLETIREYCRLQLEDRDWRALQDQHAAWARAVAARAADRYVGPVMPWVEVLAERDNLRAAVRHADAVGDVATVLAISGDTSWSWFRLGQVAESNRWLDRGLQAAGEGDVPAGLLAQARMGRARGAYLAGDLDTAKVQIVGAASAAADAGDDVLLSQAECYLAYFHAAFGDHGGAESILDAVRARDLPVWMDAEVDMVLGQVRRAQGRTEEAVAVLSRSRTVAETEHHAYIAASAGWIAGKALVDMRRHEAAGTLLAEVLVDLAEQGDRSSLITGLHTLAPVLAGLGRPYEGAVLLGAVDAIGARIGFHPMRMDAVDGPRQRLLVTEALPDQVLQAAAAEGEALSMREAVSLGVSLARQPSRRR